MTRLPGFILFIITALLFSPGNLKGNNIVFQQKKDSSTIVEKIIYEIDTAYLPPDTIRKTEIVQIKKPVKPQRNPIRNKKITPNYYYELFGSLWAFSLPVTIDNFKYSTNSTSNQQIILNFGKETQKWKYYLSFSQSRYAENININRFKIAYDTIYTSDSAIVKKNIKINKTTIRNFYLYSQFGLGFSRKIKIMKSNSVLLYPSLHANYTIPWKTKMLDFQGDKLVVNNKTPSAGLIMSFNCGVYIKIRENLKLAVMPEYSYIWKFKNEQPFSNKNIFNVYIGVFITNYK